MTDDNSNNKDQPEHWAKGTRVDCWSMEMTPNLLIFSVSYLFLAVIISKLHDGFLSLNQTQSGMLALKNYSPF